MKKTLGNTRKLRNKRGKKTKKVLRGGSLPFMDNKTAALRGEITKIVEKGNGVFKIGDAQQIIFDLIKGKINLYYLGYNNEEGNLTEYTVIVSDSKPDDNLIKAEGTFTWDDLTNEKNFYVIDNIFKKDGSTVDERKDVAENLVTLLSQSESSNNVIEEEEQFVEDTPPEENEWELLSTKVQEKDFDKYYKPLLNLISEQHFNGILTGNFSPSQIEVQGEKVRFLDGTGNIFQYKLNNDNKLEECESKYPTLKDKLGESCNGSLGRTRKDILDNVDNIRENVKKLVYADLYNLKNIFTGIYYDKIKNIKLSEGNSKYSETTETLETVVNLFEGVE